MYYEDLTPYEYFGKHLIRAFNVGWLQMGKPFTTGNTYNGFLEKLSDYANKTYHQTKGWHSCEFCSENFHSSNEIRVVGNDGRVYASPSLIFHYIKSHGYLPPVEFMEAAMYGPRPSTEKYKQSVKETMTEFVNSILSSKRT